MNFYCGIFVCVVIHFVKEPSIVFKRNMNLTLDETLHTIIGSYLLNPFPFFYNGFWFTIHIAIGIVVIVAPRHDTYRIIHVQLFQWKLKILQFILMCINFLMVVLQNNFHRS